MNATSMILRQQILSQVLIDVILRHATHIWCASTSSINKVGYEIVTLV